MAYNFEKNLQVHWKVLVINTYYEDIYLIFFSKFPIFLYSHIANCHSYYQNSHNPIHVPHGLHVPQCANMSNDKPQCGTCMVLWDIPNDIEWFYHNIKYCQ